MKKEIEAQITVKIHNEQMIAPILKIAEKGKQVTMSEKEKKYVERAFAQFEKAQQILKNYNQK